MTEFKNQTNEFNEIQKEYFNNEEFSLVSERIKDPEEFYNEIRINNVDKNENNYIDNRQSIDSSTNVISIQGEAVTKSTLATVGSSMGTAVSAIALCIVSVGVNAYSGAKDVTDNIIEENAYVQIYEEAESNDMDIPVEEDEHNEIFTEEKSEEIQEDENNQDNNKLQEFKVQALNFTGTYDGNSHTGKIVNVPAHAVITYGESPENCNLTEIPHYTDAGEYIVYYMVKQDGYNTYTGSFRINIDKKTVTPPPPSANELMYDGSLKNADVQYNEDYKYSGEVRAVNAGIYTMKLHLADSKNYIWKDGSSADKIVTWTIKPRELTIEWNGQHEYKYDGKKHIVDVMLGNIVPGDFLKFNVSGNYAQEAGSYTAEVVSFAGAGSENYVLPKKCSYNWKIVK